MNIKSIPFLVLAALTLWFALPARAADAPALSEPAKSVYDNYMKIRAALAADSMKGVAANARLIARTAQADESKTLPPTLGKEAEALAKAGDLAAAREAFKPLSRSLIKHLADNKVPKGAYYEVYCPMAQASWLQTNKDVSNPYMGKEMATCGVVKE